MAASRWSSRWKRLYGGGDLLIAVLFIAIAALIPDGRPMFVPDDALTPGGE